MIRIAAITVALLLAGASAQAQKPAPARSLQGLVNQVIDGDTVVLTSPGQPPMTVRLRDIDAPESCQPWGQDARKALAELALNKVATVQTSARDSYGRTIGTLLIDDLNVGRWMVENGHAWSIRSRWDQGPLVKEEKMARALARGLHGQGGAVQPWEFRRTKGPCAAGEVAAAPASAAAAMAAARFRCDGRTHCSQMTSCDEAKFFLANCPGVKMDGGARNGVPCEKQWCGLR